VEILTGRVSPMANSNVHVLAGASLGAGTYVGFCYLTEKEIEWGKVVGSALVGALAALAPDLLEPALNPHHRKFFHSITALALLGYGNYRAIRSTTLSSDLKIAILVAFAGYASHIVMDSVTPRSLPLI
jgi:inner membrane protein